MSVKLKIKITKQILKESCGCQGQPIFRDAYVTPTRIYIFDKCRSGRDFPTTQEMEKFICKFDSSTSEEIRNFPEQEFELEIPDSIIETINIEEVTKILENHPNLELIS